MQWLPADDLTSRRGLATARADLDDEHFAAAWAAGRALPLAQAVADALDPALIPSDQPHSLLPPREMEILRVIVAGHPDRAIAAALFISVRTVENHVAHIFAKLRVRTRTTAATAAITAGLVDPIPPHTPVEPA